MDTDCGRDPKQLVKWRPRPPPVGAYIGSICVRREWGGTYFDLVADGIGGSMVRPEHLAAMAAALEEWMRERKDPPKSSGAYSPASERP